LLIAIEGIDGAGKRTQTKLLVDALRHLGITSTWVSFPRYGETLASDLIARYLNGEFGALESISCHLSALLYAEDRFQSRYMLEKLCATYEVVVADRYVASNIAYQGARMLIPERTTFFDWLANVEYAINGMRTADLTVYLDVPVSTSQDLVAQKGSRTYTDLDADLHESNATLLSNCRATYRALCERQYRSQWLMVECVDAKGGMRSIEDIHAEVLEKVQKAAGIRAQ